MSRDVLLSTALELFARRGVDGASIAQIAAAADTSKANVMHHFRSKDALYRACLEQVGDRLRGTAEEAAQEVAGGADPATAVRAGMQRWADDHPDDVRLMTYGLLRLQERPGPWVLDSAVEALMRVLEGTADEAAEVVVSQLGLVTYAVIAAPLERGLRAAAARSRHPDDMTPTRTSGTDTPQGATP
ncbi:TetR/AcrR family transcriptional regulator [Euzebya tangerina]|uniref:TetR/AcrR family transcriptional regulator n=1 Tax=Euzebya tangerina TaxID=591198 RepID=UPI0013C3679A|nr:TetR/AcrR family transcriptional regulator [Euzebya tangerina]